ncbi:MAG: hypothetical protein ACK5NN_06780 [Sphingomonadaceae bacterium]
MRYSEQEQTNLQPAPARFGQILFLSPAEALFVTGVNLLADGGCPEHGNV